MININVPASLTMAATPPPPKPGTAPRWAAGQQREAAVYGRMARDCFERARNMMAQGLDADRYVVEGRYYQLISAQASKFARELMGIEDGVVEE